MKEDEKYMRNSQHLSYIILNSVGFTTLMSGIQTLGEI